MFYAEHPFWMFPILLCLAMARLLGCVLFISIFSARYMSRVVSSAICLALALPQAYSLWGQKVPFQVEILMLMGFLVKEVLLGSLLGALLSLPFWALNSAWTLIDNQRGANAAQQTNPSLSADASILGELVERAFVVYLIEVSALVYMFDAILRSYEIWPALMAIPDFSHFAQSQVISSLSHMISTCLMLASPVLLMLLLIEYGLSMSSLATQGFDVYQASMPIKSLSAMVLMALYTSYLFQYMYQTTFQWWMYRIFETLG